MLCSMLGAAGQQTIRKPVRLTSHSPTRGASSELSRYVCTRPHVGGALR